MPYTPKKPSASFNPEELAARIPGWGVDRDPEDRPSVPREQFFEPSEIGAHWELPESQPEKWPRERSIEHERLPPVFGTSCPPQGLSGMMRRFAYARYSEARAAHWLLLMLADRVDAAEHHVAAFLQMRPDNPITESGMKSEFTHNGLAARRGQRRADVVHHPLDPLIIVGPWIAAGGAALRGLKIIRKVVTAAAPSGREQASGSRSSRPAGASR
ncbi:MAG TPA: hypothetical protein VEG38_08785 [Acidimicrobiia bacterium]|nr:hypothetical protein [Acidimicrobiia bacterium]